MKTNKTTPFKATTAVLPLLTFTLAASLPAHAKTEAGQFEVSPFVGIQMFDSGHNLEDALTYGIRLGYSFTDRWTLEGALFFVGSSVDDTDLLNPGRGQFSSPIGDVDLTVYQLDALYHFRPENTFSPYIVFGYGATDYSPSISDKEMSTFNIGVGAKYWISDNLAMRFDLRDHFVSEVFDEGFHNLSATVGLTLAFGGKSSARSAPVTEASPAPAPRAAAPRQEAATAEVIALEFEDIHFDFDRSTLTPEAQAILQRSVNTLKENPRARVRIAGYTSASGTAAHNQALSERRADAIKSYLVEQGIATRRLATIGYGDTRPASHEANPSNKESVAAKENMRALFEIIIE
ncbi:OmpA family protein [Marinimicrobium alkaliphilum]|uniref:OmpA family protein n=1 Tax=Marinimicrobium alkaliphilum TaxID=2202654 RepID=UPI000DB967A3|nr:OmpA family protein [Marinimicrobium alkaliphilum]